MSSYIDFFYAPPTELRRKRVLDAIDSKFEDLAKNGPSKSELSQQLLTSSIESYKRASDKANIIMHYAEKVALKYTIPVPPESAEIRQAVSRQDPDGSNNGSYITFSLFQNCIEKIEKEATKIDYSVINDHVSVDPIGEERRIRAKLSSELDEDDDLFFLLLIGGQILTLFLIHEITGIWRGSEQILSNPKFAGPMPVEPGSALIEALREMAVGFAVSSAVLGINDALRFILADTGLSKDVDRSTVIQGAIGQAKQVDLPPLVQKAIKALGINDHQIILQYAIKYVSSSQDRGYEFWLSYIMARKARYISKRAISLTPALSSTVYASKNLGYKSDGPLIKPEDVVLSDPNLGTSRNTSFTEFVAAGLVDAVNSAVVSPSSKFLCVADLESSNLERMLNNIAQTLDTRVSREAVCCLVRFLGSLDRSLLKKIRTILSIYLNANMSLLNMRIDNLLPRLLSWARTTIIRMIITLIHQIMEKIMSTIVDFVVDISEDMSILIECPLILEMINGILESISFILNDLEELIDKIVLDMVGDVLYGLGLPDDNIGGKGQEQATGLYMIHQKRSITQILRVIDKILAIVDHNITICEEQDIQTNIDKGITTVTFDQVTDDLANNIDDYLYVPDNVKASYFGDATEVSLPNGRVIPKYTDGVVTISSPDGSHAKSDCLPIFGLENLEKIIGKHGRK